MKRLSLPGSIAAAAFGLVALAGASAAQARSEVFFSISVQPQQVYVQPAPIYVEPRPVYVQPRPVYMQPQPIYVQPQPIYVLPRPVYGQPRPVYVQPQPVYVPQYYGYSRPRGGPWGDRDGDGVPNLYDRDGHGQKWRHRGFDGRGDRDYDGIPNNRDRFPENRHRY